MFVFLLWGAAYPGWLVSPGPCLFGSTQMRARPRCSLHKTVRHQQRLPKPSQTCPIPFPLEAMTDATIQWEQWRTKGKHSPSRAPLRRACVCQLCSSRCTCAMRCTIELNVANRHVWGKGFLQLGQISSSSSLSRRVLQAGKKGHFGETRHIAVLSRNL